VNATMSAINIEEELSRWAHELRPVGGPFVSVLEIAHRLGIVVSIRVHTTGGSPDAQIDFRHQPPQILLYRSGSVEGHHEVQAYEESILTSRERFSVAHELGHWFAVSHLGVSTQLDKKAYWEHERAVNEFAGRLLAPDWLVRSWLRDTPEGVPIHPFALRFWATSACRTSEEVIAKAIVRHRSSIGFLKLLPATNKNASNVLLVLSSAAGKGLLLPKERSHLDSPVLYRFLSDSKVGSTSLQGIRLGRCEAQDLQMAWRRGYSVNSQETIWLSLALQSDNCADVKSPDVQLLFKESADPAWFDEPEK